MKYLIQEKHEPNGDGGDYGVYWSDLVIVDRRPDAFIWIKENDTFDILRIIPLEGEVEEITVFVTKHKTNSVARHKFDFADV